MQICLFIPCALTPCTLTSSVLTLLRCAVVDTVSFDIECFDTAALRCRYSTRQVHCACVSCYSVISDDVIQRDISIASRCNIITNVFHHQDISIQKCLEFCISLTFPGHELSYSGVYLDNVNLNSVSSSKTKVLASIYAILPIIFMSKDISTDFLLP